MKEVKIELRTIQVSENFEEFGGLIKAYKFEITADINDEDGIRRHIVEPMKAVVDNAILLAFRTVLKKHHRQFNNELNRNLNGTDMDLLFRYRNTNKKGDKKEGE